MFVMKIVSNRRKVNLHKIVQGMGDSLNVASGTNFLLYLIVALISCIVFRRDKENCHECRYCCTLSICDTNKGPKFRFSDRALKKVQEKARKDKYYQSNSAAFGYSHDMRLFKHYDYRCLKPIQICLS